jgi:2-amino-4-hydroxy-6-hydroxymethyldihydropteridine diphosphokinase
VSQRSSYYETEPVEILDQPNFVNIACEVITALDPGALLQRCQMVESRMGRVRSSVKGPRIIDIDVVFYADSIIRENGICVPHPGVGKRRFVLVPLVEIAAAFRDPLSGYTVADLLCICPDRSWVRRLTPRDRPSLPRSSERFLIG